MGDGGIPVVVMGLGEIGRAIARAALAHPGLRLVGAADPALAGRPLADLVEGAPPVAVEAELRDAIGAARRGVVLHATSSLFDEVRPQLESAVRAGFSVVSTCEELAWPWFPDRLDAAMALDALCQQNDVAIVGTGVNPGFVLDRVPAVLAQITGPVRHVLGVRVVDAALRRAALQRKIGAGLTPEAFDEAYDRGEVGHVGLAESAALVAKGCGLDLRDEHVEAEVDEDVTPLVAEEDSDGEVPIRAGQVAGVQHVARVFHDEREFVRLELTIAVGAEDPRDEIEIDADPPVRALFPGGIAGDLATAHSVVNAALAIGALRPGVATVLDLPSGR